METPKSRSVLATQVGQLSADELDLMRREAKQDGDWAKLQLRSPAEDLHDSARGARDAQKLVELNARFDQRLSSLNEPEAHQALNAFMEEPIELSKTSRGHAPYR